MFYSVDRLIPGRPLHELIPLFSSGDRERALASYADAVFEIASLPAVRREYGEFLRDDDSIAGETWSGYLLARMRRSLEASPWLREDVPSLDEIVAALKQQIEALPPSEKSLVHGDYFPGNVLMSDELQVSGVIDFGPLTVIGHPTLDFASAVVFLSHEIVPGCTPSDTQFVRDRVVARAGPEVVEAIAMYRAWYAIRFAPYRDDDPKLYRWCVASLRDSQALLEA